MDQNSLIEIIKGGISAVNSTLSAFVGAFFTVNFGTRAPLARSFSTTVTEK